jgi:hypothetical protein
MKNMNRTDLDRETRRLIFTKQTTAAEVLERNIAKARADLVTIAGVLDKLEAQAKANTTNYGYAGDAAYLASKLHELTPEGRDG